MRTPDFLPIDFVVVGGSLTGLSAAIALCRVGHRVTVVDPLDPFQPTHFDAGIRLPPNATKVYYRWGMEQRLRKCMIKSHGTYFASYDSGSMVGSHDWEEGMLEETGGDFLHAHYSDLRLILAESAREHGAQFRVGMATRIVPHEERPSVTLDSGEVLEADVLVGADGSILETHSCRRAVLEALEQDGTPVPLGMSFYNCVVPEESMERSEDKALLADLRSRGKVFMWTGSHYGAMGYSMKMTQSEEPIFTFIVYIRHESEDRTGAFNVSRESLVEALKDADPRLRELAAHASRVTCVPMLERPSLEEWIHPDGRLICIGESAHPIAANSAYSAGMAAGDAAVLGRMFSHLHSKEQIDTFLSAVQEIRQERVKTVVEVATSNVLSVALPPGVAAAFESDHAGRADDGLRRLQNGLSETQMEMAQMIEEIFGYDPEDQADDWWVQWGVMQERARRWNLSGTLSVHVEEDQDEQSE